MNELERALAAMKAAHEGCKTASASIEAATTDEARVAAEKDYAAKNAEFEQAKARVARQREIAAREAALAEVDTTVPAAKATVPSRIEVDGSPEKDEALRRSFFLQYMAQGAKALQGNQYDAIRAKDHRFAQICADDPVMIPRTMVGNIICQTPRGAKVCVAEDSRSPFGAKVVLSTDTVGGSTDSGAANLLAPDFRPSLLTFPVYAPTLYDFCRLIVATNGRAEWPKLDQVQGPHGGVAFTWKATEGDDKGETEPVFTDFDVTTDELSGYTQLSLTALRRSAIALEATLTDLFRNAARYEWAKKILVGTGTNQPRGILETVGITSVTRETASQISWKDLTNLEYALTQGIRFGGRYILADKGEKYLKGSVDTEKRPLFTSDTGSGIRNLIGGYPYTTHEYGDLDIGDVGDVIFGDLRQYAWAMEEDIAIARSEHAEFKKGRVVVRLMCFVGGKVIYPQAFAVLDEAGS